MENSFVCAPQFVSVDRLLEIWKRDHVGEMEAFISFLSSPSADRDVFFASLETERVEISETFEGSVLSVVARYVELSVNPKP